MKKPNLSPKEVNEKWLVEQFFRQCRSWTILRNLKTRQDSKGPDVIANLKYLGNKFRIGVEVTEYQADRGPNGSLYRRSGRIWEAIWAILKKDIIPRDKWLQSLEVGIYPKVKHPPHKNNFLDLADQVCKFLHSQKTRIDSGQRQLFRNGNRTPFDNFKEFPLLQNHVMHIRASKSSVVGYHLWQISPAGVSGCSEQILSTILEDKAAKFPAYELDEINLCWLLVCATGETNVELGDPKPEETLAFQTEKVISAAKNSGFDHVLFYDRIHRWCWDVGGKNRFRLKNSLITDNG